MCVILKSYKNKLNYKDTTIMQDVCLVFDVFSFFNFFSTKKGVFLTVCAILCKRVQNTPLSSS